MLRVKRVNLNCTLLSSFMDVMHASRTLISLTLMMLTD